MNNKKYELKWPGGAWQFIQIFFTFSITCIGITILIFEFKSASAEKTLLGLIFSSSFPISLLFGRGIFVKRVVLCASGIQLQYIIGKSPKISWHEIYEVKLNYRKSNYLEISGNFKKIRFLITQGAHEHYGKVLDEILKKTNLKKTKVTANQVIYR